MHLGSEQLLERVDVVVGGDLRAVGPAGLGTELQLEDVAGVDLGGVLNALGQDDRVLLKVGLVGSGHVLDGEGHIKGILIQAFLGVEDRVVHQRRSEVGEHAGVGVGLPGVGVPVVRQ